MMTEGKYVALARQKYQVLHDLKKKTNFYDYEKMFDQHWQEMGKQILERNLIEVPADRRKKNNDDPVRRYKNS